MSGRGRIARGLRRVLWAGGAALAVFLATSFYVELRYAGRIHTRAEVPPAPVALVFGAGLVAGGEPSFVLEQRLETAVALYRAGKVKKLLVSGDNTDPYHDETRAMRRYALDRGLPSEDVVGDYAGVSTYDTCYRARHIFGVTRAILVTQDFHLPRAVYIANELGLDADGVPADPGAGRIWRHELRELFARAFTAYLLIARPEARIMGEPLPIEPEPGDVAAQ